MTNSPSPIGRLKHRLQQTALYGGSRRRAGGSGHGAGRPSLGAASGVGEGRIPAPGCSERRFAAAQTSLCKQTPICCCLNVVSQPRKSRPANKRRFAAVLEGCPEYTVVLLRVSSGHGLAPIGLLREACENCRKSAFVSKPHAPGAPLTPARGSRRPLHYRASCARPAFMPRRID